MVNSEQLKALHIDSKWVDPLNETFKRFDIATPRQQAAFIGQCGHECGHFKMLEENLNYRAETLMKLWPKRFPTLSLPSSTSAILRRLLTLSMPTAWVTEMKPLVTVIASVVVAVSS